MSVTTKELSMNTIITLAFEGKEAEEVAELARAVDLGQLLRDALGEFVAARQPEADYVTERHGFAGINYMPATTHGRFKAKLREVVKRNLLACLLKRAGVTIETSPSDGATSAPGEALRLAIRMDAETMICEAQAREDARASAEGREPRLITSLVEITDGGAP